MSASQPPNPPNQPPACPACGSASVTPIMYGYPTPRGLEAAKSGRVRLGGCVVIQGAPTWVCNDCNAHFGELDVPFTAAREREKPQSQG